jgi:hypothetical protein
MSSTNTNTSLCDLCLCDLCLCDLCERKLESKNIIKNGIYCHCKSCYTWLNTVPEPEPQPIKKMNMCSNCELRPVAKTHLCGFTDWCQYCDATLWSTKDDEKIAETE